MKDFTMIWNRFTGRRYSTVETNQNQNDSSESEEITVNQNASNQRRRSSVVVNRFFNTTLPALTENRPRWSRRIYMLMTLGSLSLATGCILFMFQPYELIFKLKVMFGPGGEIFEMWRKPDIELYTKIYLFNVTNHEEYVSGKESKLRFQEVGPYVYREFFKHGSVQFNDNGTVSAIPLHPLKYMPAMSNGTEEDELILPNIALFWRVTLWTICATALGPKKRGCKLYKRTETNSKTYCNL